MICVDFHQFQDPLHKQCRSLTKLLQTFGLYDIWQTIHNNDKEYTHYSQVHNIYSRIDRFLMQSAHLNRVITCEIETSTWSDHNPVTLTVADHYNYKNRSPWRLNEQLLHDPHFVQTLQKDMQAYFEANNTDDISTMTLWMAHKPVIRGLLVRKAS
ncbi:Hypothetical predicted protein [Pelobates cultripes]|uniref:Endonuclease/exonuclease/phosphatase domain-containing protein n=1 Tax=Pelobates cultripes TaxID=61616 RepID=A0AAD1VVC2_PELCU|nr:Hypothetical predicted protein [Pelobates cultripes]